MHERITHLRTLALAVAVVIAVQGEAGALPSFQDVRAGYASSDALLLDRRGETLQEVRLDLTGRKLEWTALSDISPALVAAVIGSEDRRFRTHRGVDWLAVSSAAVSNLFSKKKRGASTITMQLASILDSRLRPRKSQRSLAQKWAQIGSAQQLERTWTKEQVLEAYLNLVSFRGEILGISAASRGIFDKAPNGLDKTESVILAALIPSPNAAVPDVSRRAAQLAASIGSTLRSEDVERRTREVLSQPYHVRRRVDLAPHVARRLLKPGTGDRMCTIDARLQRFAADALNQAVSQLADQNVRDGAVLVAENRTGKILAYVGNTGARSSARFVDGVLARRQAGSTLKPFLYGLALERRLLTAASLVDDSPVDISTERGIYKPENYDRDYRGLVTVRTALASSLNIPAVRTLTLMGTNSFLRRLEVFGFTNLRTADQYGPSLALGTADVSLWELLNAYRTLANGGSWSRLRLIPDNRPGPAKRIMSRESSFIISDILSDREARSATFNLESPLATSYWTAVKTGTSKDMRDNWCVGYSDRYTVGVWIGNFSGEPMWNVSGISGAAPVWLEVMNYLHAGVPSRAPVRPEQVLHRTVLFHEKGTPIVKWEYFLAGTEQEQVRKKWTEALPALLYPSRDTVIALDPDIPGELQRVFFESSASDPELAMVLDENVIGHAPAVSWQPVPGMHILSLVAADGTVADRISFEVK